MRVNQSGNARHEIELPVAFVCLSPARCRQSLQGGLPPCPAAVQVRCPSNPSKSAVQVAVPSPLSKSRFQVRCARFRHPWVVAWHADCHTLACVPPEKKGRSLACRRSGQRAYINKPMVDIHALGVPQVGIRSRMRPVTIAATRAVAARSRSSMQSGPISSECRSTFALAPLVAPALLPLEAPAILRQCMLGWC